MNWFKESFEGKKMQAREKMYPSAVVGFLRLFGVMAGMYIFKRPQTGKETHTHTNTF